MGAEVFSQLEGTDAQADLPFAEGLERVVEQFERSYLSAQLRRFGGQIQKVARVTGLSRRTIERKMKKYALERRGFLPSAKGAGGEGVG